MPDEFCPRQITFRIPGNPGVTVTAIEVDGALQFTVVADGTTNAVPDLRGLFFDINEGKMAGLTVSGDSAVTGSRVAEDSVLDLGHGTNMNGKTRDGFDVGIEFGTAGRGREAVGEVSFTISNAAGDLTLDDIAHQRFGARLDGVGGGTGPRDGGATKLIGTAPAAPDATNDVIAMFEDGASGLNDPSKTPTPVVLNVLANDTDADGDPLTITSIHEQPAHGTIAIAADGKSLIYTPELDYSGQVTFEYCVSDGAGGQDHALVTLNIEAVADRPVSTATWETTGVVNEILLHVSAEQADADSSEYLASLLSSSLPAGVTISPVGVATVGEPDTIGQDFLLVLPMDQDTAFDLTFTAQSTEVSNGDTETPSVTVPIIYEYTETTNQALFLAADQNIWAFGDAFTFVDDRFIGVDAGEFNEQIGDTLYAGISGHVQLGLQSTLTFNGGEIDATAGYDLTVDTNYNKTTDVLLIGTSALVTSAHFDTVGPEGSYVLQFLYDVALSAYAGVNLDFGELGSINEGGTIFSLEIGPASYDLLNLDSAALGGTFTLPPPLDSLSVDFAWPHISTTGDYPPNPVVADGTSNNFVQLNLDLDQMVSQILFGGANPFDPPAIWFGPFFADPDILDVGLSAGLNFIQQFSMALGTLSGFLLFEDGSSQAFIFGDEVQIFDASLIDIGGDGDGLVEFTFALAPDATLTNDTDLGFNVGINVSLLSVELGYDIGFASDNTTLGPLAEFGTVVPVASIDVYSDSFDLAYAQQQFAYAA